MTMAYKPRYGDDVSARGGEGKRELMTVRFSTKCMTVQRKTEGVRVCRGYRLAIFGGAMSCSRKGLVSNNGTGRIGQWASTW